MTWPPMTFLGLLKGAAGAAKTRAAVAPMLPMSRGNAEPDEVASTIPSQSSPVLKLMQHTVSMPKEAPAPARMSPATVPAPAEAGGGA